MGGAGKSMYFLTVFLETPSCRAMPLRGTPWRAGKDLFNAQFPHGPGEPSGPTGWVMRRGLSLNSKTPWRSP